MIHDHALMISYEQCKWVYWYADLLYYNPHSLLHVSPTCREVLVEGYITEDFTSVYKYNVLSFTSYLYRICKPEDGSHRYF